MEPSEVEDVAKRVYRETARFYAEIEPRLAPHAHGFKILYGPPTPRPEMLFVGYQPGGDSDDRAADLAMGAEKRWPKVCEYAGATWPLSAWMRSMFGVEFLKRCSGLNALFIRARGNDAYRKVSPSVRREVADFSLPRAAELIEAIEPIRVVFIGFDALRLFGPTVSVLRNDAGRSLVERGAVSGRDALGVMHLSGARISSVDRAAIAAFVLGKRQPKTQPATRSVTLRLPEHLMKQAREVASERDVPVDELLVKLIKEGLAHRRDSTSSSNVAVA